jgi:hypothetical protein
VNGWLIGTTALMVALTCVGCAGRQAQTLAGDLLALTQNYDAQRQGKAQAELKYYQEQLRLLRGALGGSELSTDDKTIRMPIPVEKTVAYGRIVTSARQDAYVLAEGLLGPGNALPGAALLKYLDQGIRDDSDAYLETQRRQQQLRADLLATLEKLDLQEARVDTITKQLKALKEPPTLNMTLQQLFAIGSEIQKRIEKGEVKP